MIRTIKNMVYLILIALVSLIPFWLYLGARDLLNPQSFFTRAWLYGYRA